MSLDNIDINKLSAKDKKIYLKVKKLLKEANDASDRVIKGAEEIKKLEKEGMRHYKNAVKESKKARGVVRKMKKN